MTTTAAHRVRMITPRRVAFLLHAERRIEARGGFLSYWDVKALDRLFTSADMLAVRERCQRAGFRLAKARAHIGGAARSYLVHTDRRAP